MVEPLELLVIDEAAQLKECESLIPLQLTGIRHAILIGDVCQLPAMVKSKVCDEAGFGRSLFERLSSLGHKKHLLDVQYRMHPSISRFPNAMFYDSKISDGSNVTEISYGRRYLDGRMYGTHCLWIVGNEPTLRKSRSIWARLVEDAKVRGCFFNADEDERLSNAITQFKTLQSWKIETARSRLETRIIELKEVVLTHGIQMLAKSGKTYNALKQLEKSSSGMYCGPLRLLAWEVAKRLNKANMIGCRTRGYSFTRALLGIPADELHLCGDAAAVPLVQEILKVTGDLSSISRHTEMARLLTTAKACVQYYERLSPLIPSKVPLGSFSNIQTGDCIVTFSRREIYNLKKEIEERGKHLCSVVYGSLPPETRTRQLFPHHIVPYATFFMVVHPFCLTTQSVAAILLS
ncbi:hypothetical protein QJS10_CPB22g01221 [Acorus calamus]|uniref:Uncharacterized protein n=1 Tax=Acorus calamus TaxID=4465 RepID=A0AAV9C008_ACOCL|nr:hypothetical protein QJS10_CPB22g01221 [Acorus calamus]